MLLWLPVQTPAIDVWSAGVVLLCLLARRYPVFDVRSGEEDDALALAQIGELCGNDALARAFGGEAGGGGAENGAPRAWAVDYAGKEGGVGGGAARALRDACQRGAGGTRHADQGASQRAARMRA